MNKSESMYVLKEIVKITHGKELDDKEAEGIMRKLAHAHVDDILDGKYDKDKEDVTQPKA